MHSKIPVPLCLCAKVQRGSRGLKTGPKDREVKSGRITGWVLFGRCGILQLGRPPASGKSRSKRCTRRHKITERKERFAGRAKPEAVGMNQRASSVARGKLQKGWKWNAQDRNRETCADGTDWILSMVRSVDSAAFGGSVHRWTPLSGTSSGFLQCFLLCPLRCASRTCLQVHGRRARCQTRPHSNFSYSL